MSFINSWMNSSCTRTNKFRTSQEFWMIQLINNTFSYYLSVVNGRYTIRWKEIQDFVIINWQQKAFHTCYCYDWTNGEKKIFLSCYVTENYWWCKRIRLFCERKRKERRLNFNWFCCDLSIIFSTSHWHFKIFINFFVTFWRISF